MNTVILKPGRDKSLLRRHPWVFSGAIADVKGQPASGESVRVQAADGRFLAHAAYSPDSQIRCRAWNFDASVKIDTQFIGDAVRRSAMRRGATTLARLVHGEADGLPGVIADRYGDTVVLQALSAGAEYWRDTIGDALSALPGVERVYERSDADVRELEGLVSRTGVLRGAEPLACILIQEATTGVRYGIDVRSGHKTGFYLDQSINRAIVGALCAGADLLNCFCYTGGFTLSALNGGARSALSIDSSGPALELARRNTHLNGYDASRCEWMEADVFKALRELRNAGRGFDVVILDPPKFAPTPATVERAARAYKDINLLGLKLLNPGGRLVTFSCSGGVSPELFQKIVAGAAADANVDARIEQRLMAAPDHPVLLSFPEGEYLKGVVLRRT